MCVKTVLINCTNCGVEFQKPLFYIKQGQKRGYTNHFCSNKCSCEHNRKTIIPSILLREREIYYKSPKTCLNCSSIIKYEKKNDNLNYCSSRCFATHSQKDGGYKRSELQKEKLSKIIKNCWEIGKYDQLKRKINKTCPFCNNQFETINSRRNKICCSRKCYDKWCVKTGYLKGKTGGYRPNSGTSKKGWYKGYFCGSSWELAWVIYNLDHNIKFDRNHRGFNYNYENKIKKYYPDFVIGNEYIEIKGYHSKQFDAKVSQFPLKLKILHKAELHPVLEYVKNTYGKNFVSLYEKC